MTIIVPMSVHDALTEATTHWPNRSTVSDGTIGDYAHSQRVSDHNPDSRGIVHAYDLTQDAAAGCDCAVLSNWLRDRVLSGEEKRVKYMIWDRFIFDPAISPSWRAYNGSDPHTGHMHVSILSGVRYETDESPWWPPLNSPIPVPVTPHPIYQGDFDVPDNKTYVDACPCYVSGCPGSFALQYDGGVEAKGDHTNGEDHFLFSYWSDELKDARNDPNRRFYSIVVDEGRGYTLMGTDGTYYGPVVK